MRRVEVGEDEGCVHCHEVQRTAIDSYFMKRIELPDKMLWMYPRPQVLGLTFDGSQCARIGAVAADSVAAAAGLHRLQSD